MIRITRNIGLFCVYLCLLWPASVFSSPSEVIAKILGLFESNAVVREIFISARAKAVQNIGQMVMQSEVRTPDQIRKLLLAMTEEELKVFDGKLTAIQNGYLHYFPGKTWKEAEKFIATLVDQEFAGFGYS